MKLAKFCLLSLLIHGIFFCGLGIPYLVRNLPQDLQQIEISEVIRPSNSKSAKVSAQKPNQILSKPVSNQQSSEKTETNENSKSVVNENLDSVKANSQDFVAYEVGQVTESPRLQHEVKVNYPPEAKRAGVEGVVELKLLISEKGKVEKVEVIKGPGFGLNEVAAKAAQEFLFSPAKIKTETVAVRIIYKYKFVLNR